jgi:hypothetical protein
MEDTRQAMEATQQGRKELESHQTQLTRQLRRCRRSQARGRI